MSNELLVIKFVNNSVKLITCRGHSPSLVEDVLANLQFEFIDSSLNSKYILLKSGLLVLELSDLRLQPAGLGLLVRVVSLDLLLDPVQLVGESFARVVLLHGQHRLERLLLAPEDLHLLLVRVQVLLQAADRLIKVVQLALQVSCVVIALPLVAGRHVHRGKGSTEAIG